MPRRAINAEEQIITALKNNDGLSWSELQTSAKVSKGALSRHLNRLINIHAIRTKIDDSVRPPITRYFLNLDDHRLLNSLLTLKEELSDIPSYSELFNIIVSDQFLNMYFQTLSLFTFPFVEKNVKKQNNHKKESITILKLPQFGDLDKLVDLNNLSETSFLFTPFLLHSFYNIVNLEINLFQVIADLMDTDIETLFKIFDYLNFDFETDSVLLTFPLILDLDFVDEIKQFIQIWENEVAADSAIFDIYSKMIIGVYLMYAYYSSTYDKPELGFSLFKTKSIEKYKNLENQINEEDLIQFLSKIGIDKNNFNHARAR